MSPSPASKTYKSIFINIYVCIWSNDPPTVSTIGYIYLLGLVQIRQCYPIIFVHLCFLQQVHGHDAAPPPAGQQQALSPRSWNKREQIWIFYFWFIEVIIYFFIVPLPICVGKCFVFYMSPPDCIKCKDIKRHSVWNVRSILSSIIEPNTPACSGAAALVGSSVERVCVCVRKDAILSIWFVSLHI